MSPHAQGRLRLAAGIALAGACTRASDTPRFEPISDRLEILETIPSPGATDVPPNAQLDFCFSGYLDPRSLDDFDATLLSGKVVYDTQLDLQLFAWRPPGAPSGSSSEAWCPGSVLSLRAKKPLAPDLLHRVRLLPSAVGWAGEELDVSTPGWVLSDRDPQFVLEFYPRAAEPTDPPDGAPEPAPTLTDLFSPGQVFALDNPSCGCHREPGGLAFERLDLSSPQDAFAGLVLPTTPMSTGFPMVSPRRPAESYLVQSLLRDDDGEALHGVRGGPMPPDAPLAHADMTLIVRWIEGGALP